MPTSLAAHANADSAGYKRTQLDRGSGKSPRWITRYEKPSAGMPGQSGGLMSVEVTSDVNQADADTKALAALNTQRNFRYGFAAAGGSVGPAGGALTVDSH